MPRKDRKRISYVLPLADSAGGHRLGVNGLAVDSDNSILYSAGRDGVINAWNLNLDLKSSVDHEAQDGQRTSSTNTSNLPTSLRQEVQAHTHWINDIVLTNNNSALASASSDLTVKVWRPTAQEAKPPQTIGVHTDYVKVLASPGLHSDWVASGGLDRKICLWDINGAGNKLQIAVSDEGNTEKGSVYALAATSTVLASGGPESIVRVWDTRTGKRVTKFVGHTDNIRDVLIAQDGETIMTCSSDQTVKVWSMTAGRCMYTLTMHNDSVWSLCSDHPRLSVFYSSDRSGLIAKTDCRGYAEMDEGLSIALCQEHNGVNKIISSGDYVWTATASSSINRWKDVDTAAEVQIPEPFRPQRNSIVSIQSKTPLSPGLSSTQANGTIDYQIPLRCLLRLSNAAPYPIFQPDDMDSQSVRKASQDVGNTEHNSIQPFRNLPDHTIEGQNGLIKHHMLKDRRRVLTLDTAGDVTLWDLILCTPIKSFGKCHLDDVIPSVDTLDAVAHWCTVDTRTGSLTCVLEENYCFDAEMYADELELEEKIEFREDQRVNLGKWILRYLFSNLIDEEIKRDEAYRHQLLNDNSTKGLQRVGAPSNITLPTTTMNGWKDPTSGPTSASTVKIGNGYIHAAQTPGLAIGVATPAAAPPLPNSHLMNPLPPTTEEEAPLETTASNGSHRQTSSDKPGDYFSAVPVPAPALTPNHTALPTKPEGEDTNLTALPTSPSETRSEAKENQSGGFKFGKKFNMTMPSFNMPKLKKTTTASETAPKTPAPEAPVSSDASSTSSKADDRAVEDNFLGCVQRIRQGYEDTLHTGQTTLTSAITPSLPNETPVVKPPANTTVLIQEDRPDSGGFADLFEGKVGSLGLNADLIEKAAPMWLGEVLLKNQPPVKDLVKVSFVLEPYQNLLPSIASDGNSRLNANRMLRARKIMTYVAERIEPQPEKPDPNAMKPEEYLELYCHNQLISPTMTLATIRAHVWRGGGDVVILYKANGKKPIAQATKPTTDPPQVVPSGGAEENQMKDASQKE